MGKRDRAAKKRAVVLLSGGLDSATALAVAVSKGLEVHALSFDYGQRHRRELRAARRLARFFGVKEHRIMRLALGKLGGSALTDRRVPVPEGRAWRPGQRIPSTYVPARNLVFLSIAAAYAETVGAGSVVIGANALDYSGYPDCRPAFLRSFSRSARLGTRTGAFGRPLRVMAPLLRLTKGQIIRLGLRLGVPYGLTWSCYRGRKRPCGRCDSCLLRQKGFQEAGASDPLLDRARARRPSGKIGRRVRGEGGRTRNGRGRREAEGGRRGTGGGK